MKELKISPNFTVEDIHNLRVYIGEKYSSMSKEEADNDFNLHYQETKKAIEDLRKANN
ncbi:hypothetical protein AGMMS49592_3870 [Endomicrobiia bacterium]|nr:hypothetical protein AGMMS49592_3870 [Endomicrobiia bacterium]GHT51754.1 hypothetical protein AGMMS49990_06740 [Endomicrobiia bacterium]